jgi:four helix bundle protein
MHDFQRLHVWQRSRDLAVETERVARSFPHMDRGVVSSQLRRAVISIPANIAEGCGKSSRKESLRFLQIAAGSASEAQNHVLIASELGYLTAQSRDDLLERLNHVQRMLHRLMHNFPICRPRILGWLDVGRGTAYVGRTAYGTEVRQSGWWQPYRILAPTAPSNPATARW